MAIRVAVVEDHHLVREGLRHVLETHGIEVVGEATGIAGAFDLIDSCHPDVLLVDLNLDDGDGVVLLQDIRARTPEQRVVENEARPRPGHNRRQQDPVGF